MKKSWLKRDQHDWNKRKVNTQKHKQKRFPKSLERIVKLALGFPTAKAKGKQDELQNYIVFNI